MKKLYTVCLIILLMFLLVSCVNSCGNKDALPADNNQNPQDHESNSAGQVPFSLDKGISWYFANKRLAEFDIWDVMTNEEVPEMVFFYATSYQQFLEEVENNRTPTFNAYRYLDDEGWNKLINDYPEEFFEENILLFYYKFEPTKNDNYVYDVEIKDNSLTLNVNRMGGGWFVVSTCLEFITIKKTDVENITEFNVAVRSVSELKSSIIFYLSDNNPYIRDMYVNGLSKADFPGLNNLESVIVRTYGIMVDIILNETVTDERLNEIVTILKTSENIDSVYYTSTTLIKVTLKNKLYDKFIEKTITIDDVLDNKIENSNGFTMEITDIKPHATITLEMEQHGRDFYYSMIEQLIELNFPFINIEELKGILNYLKESAQIDS